MTTFTFTDNRAIRTHFVRLSPRELAEHLLRDDQFAFYWRKRWDPHLAATRSLYLYPPHPKAHVAPSITADQWLEVEQELIAIELQTAPDHG